MKIEQLDKADGERPPEGVHRFDYISDVDQLRDWALISPSKTSDTCVVCIHGHGSHGDQLYTRADIRDGWLPVFKNHGFGILTPNLRDDAWMSPGAVRDMRDLLAFMRGEFDIKRFIFASGSMGGTSNLIYASLHPEDVAGVISLGAATDLGSYHTWCTQHPGDIVSDIARAIEASYEMMPAGNVQTYEAHSVQRNAHRLKMPVFISHGNEDSIIPVSQVRLLAGEMGNSSDFLYSETAGEHDTPMSLMGAAMDWIIDKIQHKPGGVV